MNSISASGTVRRPAIRYPKTPMVEETDVLAVEEPLEVRFRIGGGQEKPAGILMRTPVHDDWLAAGYLYTEGILKSGGWISKISGGSGGQHATGNTITVQISEENGPAPALEYGARLVNSSCGVCGKGSINEVFIRSGRIIRSGVRVKPEVLTSLPEKLRHNQYIFSETGGLHAAGLFRPDGELVVAAEDVGRHNAVDKVIGYCILNNVPMGEGILQVSGRSGFEIVQKAAVAGIPIVSAVSAPSSLAVDLCESLGITLACFVREGRFNAYTNIMRIDFPR